MRPGLLKGRCLHCGTYLEREIKKHGIIPTKLYCSIKHRQAYQGEKRCKTLVDKIYDRKELKFLKKDGTQEDVVNLFNKIKEKEDAIFVKYRFEDRIVKRINAGVSLNAEQYNEFLDVCDKNLLNTPRQGVIFCVREYLNGGKKK